MRKWLLILLFLICIPVVLVYLYVLPYMGDGRASVTIVNQAEETAVLLQVQVHENIQTANNLKHGEAAEMQFLVKFDTSYYVDVEFISGRKIKKDVGYLTYGLNVTDVITITKTDIVFTTKEPTGRGSDLYN